MADEAAELLVKIQADVSDLKAKFEDVGKHGNDLKNGLKDTFKDIKKTVGELFALDKIKDFGMESLHAFTETQKAMAKLQDTVRGSGGDWEKLGGKVDAYIKQSVRNTKFQQEEVITTLDKMTFKVGDVNKAMSLQTEAFKFSRVTGKDLAESTDILTNAYLGNQRGVKQMALALGITGKGAKDAGGLFDTLDKKTKALGNSQDTLAKHLRDAGKAWADLQEDVGKEMAPAWMFMADLAKVWIPNIIKGFQSMGAYAGYFIGQIINSFNNLIDDAASLGTFLKDVWKHPIEASKLYFAAVKSHQLSYTVAHAESEKALTEELAKIWKKREKIHVDIKTDGVAAEARANQKRIRDEEETAAMIKTIWTSTTASYKELAESIVVAATTSKEAWKDVGKAMVRHVVDALITVLDAYAAKEAAMGAASLYEGEYADAAKYFLASGAFSAGSGAVKGLETAYLAEGGIVDKPTLAVIGEGGEPEAVMPLSKAGQMGFGGGKTEVHAPINLPNVRNPSDFSKPSTRRTIERTLAAVMDKVQQRKGLRLQAGIA